MSGTRLFWGHKEKGVVQLYRMAVTPRSCIISRKDLRIERATVQGMALCVQ